MNLGWVVALAVLLTVGRAGAQEILFLDPSVSTRAGTPQFTLLPPGPPNGLPTPLFLEQSVPPGATDIHGTVNGLAVGPNTTLEIGFDYLRPFWSFRDFTLAVPRGAVGNFTFLGDTGHVDDHFAFAPHLNLFYRLPESDYGIGASGSFLNLNGQLHRDNTITGGGTSQLDATSNLTLVLFNFVEVTRRVDFADLLKKEDSCPACLEDLVVDFTACTRYASLAQSYTGSLTSARGATNVSTRDSTQSFSGFGFGAGANLTLPVSHDWLLYSRARASILVGDNVRRSTLTVTVDNAPGLSATIHDNQTSYIPVVEMEVGVEWGNLLADKFRVGDTNLSFSVKAVAVMEYWGGVGPLSAGSSQAFRTSDMFLVGASIFVGIHR